MPEPYAKLLHKKIIFFDMHNTLTDGQKSFDAAFLETMREWTGRSDPDETDGFAAEILKSYKREKKNKMRTRKKRSLAELEQLYARCLQRVLEIHSLPLSRDTVVRIMKRIRSLQRELSVLHAEVKETLQQFHEKQYTMGIISNGRENELKKEIERLELTHYFPPERQFTSEVSRHTKPHRSIFQHALKVTSVHPSQAVMIGNSWRKDIYGATRVQMDAIWLHPSHKRNWSERKIGKERIYIIRRFQQLRQMFHL